MKTYTVTIKRHCAKCNEDHRVLYSTLTYKADNAIVAACKAHDYLAAGGAYHDLCHLATDPTIFYSVKERGTPRGKGIVTVEQAFFL